MALLSTNYLTLTDWAKRLDPQGKTAKIVELLEQDNEMLQDMIWTQGNLPTGHRTTVRTSLPSVYWRRMNQGTPLSKSGTAQVDEHSAMLDAWSHIDVDEAELNGNTKEYRLSEQMAFVESMNQEMQQTVLYGSNLNPEEFVGFMPRFSSLSAGNSEQILSAGGSGSDNTSILLVNWGADCFGIFPKGSKAGLSHKDHGIQMIQTEDGSGNALRMEAYVDHWKWKAGLVVRDPRAVARIANIDVSDLVGLTGTQATTASTSIIKLMSRSIDRLKKAGGKKAFYCNKTILSHLRVVALEKSSSVLSVEEGLNQFGETIYTLKFLGIPVRCVDQFTNAEAVVS